MCSEPHRNCFKEQWLMTKRDSLKCFWTSYVSHLYHMAGPSAPAQVAPEMVTPTGTEQPGLCCGVRALCREQTHWAPLTGHLAAPALVPVPATPVGAPVCPSPSALLSPFCPRSLPPTFLSSLISALCAASGLHPSTHTHQSSPSFPPRS